MCPAVQHDSVDGDGAVGRLVKSPVFLDETTIPVRIHPLNVHQTHSIARRCTTHATAGDKSTGKGSPYSITERRVPELIPVLGILLAASLQVT